MRKNKNRKSKKSKESEKSDQSSTSDVLNPERTAQADLAREFCTTTSQEINANKRKPQVIPFGTSFYVYAEISHQLPEMQFIIDTGAGVSLIPESVYQLLPTEDKPTLEKTARNVFCGNEQGIRISGIAYMPIKLQQIEYQAAFHVSPDVQKGILGSDFLERYDAHVQVARRKLLFNNRSIDIYDSRGLPLCHRIVADQTVFVPPGARYVIPAKVVKKGQLSDAPFLIEGARRLAATHGIMVARMVTKHHEQKLMVEVTNMTDQPQRINRNTTLGITHEVDDIQDWQKPMPPTEGSQEPRAEANMLECDEPPELVDSSDEEDDDDEDDEIFHNSEEPPDLLSHSSDSCSSTDEDGTAQEALRKRRRTRKRPKRVATEEPMATAMHYLFTEQNKPRATDADDTAKWTCEKVCEGLTEIPDVNIEMLPEHLREMYKDNVTEVTTARAKYCFAKLLCEYESIFARNRYDLGKTNLAKHHIDTGDSAPVKQKPRRLPQAQHDEIREQVQKLAETGIIRPSTSNYASNVLLVRKKDGTWRLCIDYRELNSKTLNKDPYMIPRIDDTLDALSGAKLFCTLDLAQGYHQVEMTEESKAKTAFLTPHMTPNLWEFDCMPFGITGGPASFQRVMDRLLLGMDHKIALAYLDDIIVFGGNFEEVIDRLARVFERIRHAGLKLKPKKCSFFQKETLYLGHLVSEHGIRCDPKKIEQVKHYPRPTTKRQCLRFAGFANYYNRFIKNFSEKAKPLYALGNRRGKNPKPFVWTDVEEKSFQDLREALISDPVMAFPNADGEWILDTDASGSCMGAVLSQMQKDDKGEKQERVIAYGSKVLQGRQQRYCTRRRELLAVVTFVKHFRPYIYGRFVKIRTDHASLRYLKTLNNPDDQFARWMEVLEETYYTIEVRKGKDHCNADALSRMNELAQECEGKRCICPAVDKLEKSDDTVDDYRTHSAAFDMPGEKTQADDDESDSDSDVDAPMPRRPAGANALSTAPFAKAEINAFKFTQKWTATEIADAQKNDPDIALLYKSKADGTGKPSSNEISCQSDTARAYFHDYNRIRLEANKVLYRQWESHDGTEVRSQMILPDAYREIMFRNLHDVVNAAHMGRRRTLDKLRRKYFWFRMGEDVRLWIRACPVCQRRKKGCKNPKAPLKIYQVGMPNERLFMDVIDHLTRTEKGNVCVLTIVDQFTKYARAIPMPNQKKETVADALLTHWVSLFGAPYQLHTDQGTNFESGLMKELCKTLGIDKSRTTPYHPSGNGGAERANSTIMNIVHTFARNDPQNWDKQLHTALMGYNSTKHAATGYEPNRLMFGRNIDMPADLMMPPDPTIQPKPVDDYVRDYERRVRFCYQLAREKLQKAATAAKKYYDRDAHLNHYKTGDTVKIREVKMEKGQKFTDKYKGPFYVIDKLGDLTYRIAEGRNTRERVLHHDMMMPYYPTPDEREEDITWVFNKARKIADAKVGHKESQTQVTVPHELATEEVPELQEPVPIIKPVADAQPMEQDVDAEAPSKSNDNVAIPQLCSRSAQTNVVFRPTSAVEEIREIGQQLQHQRSQNDYSSRCGQATSFNRGSQGYSADIIATDYNLRTRRIDIMSERPGEFDYKLEDDVYCHRAAANSLASSGRKDQSQNTLIVLGPLASTINLATQQAGLQGGILDLRLGDVVIQDGQKHHKMLTQATQTALILPPPMGEKEWQEVCQQQELLHRKSRRRKDATQSAIAPAMTQKQANDLVQPSKPVLEEYIATKWNRIPRWPHYRALQQADVSTQTLIKLNAQKDEGLTNIVEQQADLLGYGLRADGSWYKLAPPTPTYLDQIQLCLEELMLAPGDAQNDAPETKFNRRNEGTVKRVKVIAPTDPDCIEIKPRKRGRPRKAPPGECAEIAIQTDVQLNVVRVE